MKIFLVLLGFVIAMILYGCSPSPGMTIDVSPLGAKKLQSVQKIHLEKASFMDAVCVVKTPGAFGYRIISKDKTMQATREPKLWGCASKKMSQILCPNMTIEYADGKAGIKISNSRRIDLSEESIAQCARLAINEAPTENLNL